jgi:hypothetical protein
VELFIAGCCSFYIEQLFKMNSFFRRRLGIAISADRSPLLDRLSNEALWKGEPFSGSGAFGGGKSGPRALAKKTERT